jgi:hypothetical protein
MDAISSPRIVGVQRDPRQTLSRQPTPRLDQLRALREAKFARAEQRQKEAQKLEARRPETASGEPAPVALAAQSAPSKAAAKAKTSASTSAPKPAARKAVRKEAAQKPARKKKKG